MSNKSGNRISLWEKKDGEEEREKTREEYLEYDEMGHLIHDEEYDLQWGGKIYEMICMYNKEGKQTYYQLSYNGEIFLERECCVMSGSAKISREYKRNYPQGEGPDSYMEEKWDEQGNTLTSSCQYGGGEKLYPIYENEYDDRGNLIKELYYYWDGDAENEFYSCTERYYNEEDLLVKKVMYTGDDKEVWPESTETYTYDEAGNLIHSDYLSGNGTGFSVLKEYDILGNQIREYKADRGTLSVTEDMDLIRNGNISIVM